MDGLTKTYGRLAAIDAVSFDIRAGEVLGLIGPNGAGKTTLFECLAGVRPATSGAVRDGRGAPIDVGARAARIFYVPDGIRPYPDQPVWWVLDYTIGRLGRSPAAKGEVVRALDLARLLHQPMRVLSKGQAKRALLAMGLLTPQPILMIDEPFEGLDLRQTRDAAAALRMFASAGRTLFLSIHQIGDAGRVCDRLVLLSGGRVRGQGTPAELVAAGQATDLEEAFLALT